MDGSKKYKASGKKVWKITEKLSRLTENKRLVDVAIRAQLKPTQVRDYTVKGSPPRYDIGLRLARALNVPADWLLDEAAEWPPPPVDAKPSLPSLSDRELMLEVGRRFRIGFIAILDALDAMEKEDWGQIRQRLESWKGDDPQPMEAQRIRLMLDALASVNAAQLRYSPAYFSLANHSILPGKDRSIEDFDPARFDERLRNLYENKDFVHVARGMAAVAGRTQWGLAPTFEDGSRWAESGPLAPGPAPSLSSQKSAAKNRPKTS